MHAKATNLKALFPWAGRLGFYGVCFSAMLKMYKIAAIKLHQHTAHVHKIKKVKTSDTL